MAHTPRKQLDAAAGVRVALTMKNQDIPHFWEVCRLYG
jgi:hypothetical protein